MRTICIASTAIVFSLFISCRSHDSKNADSVKASFSFTEGNYTETLDYSGVIRLTANDSAIQSISPGGYVRLRRNNERIDAEPGDNGQVVYRYFKDDKETAFEQGGQQLVDEAVRQMLRNGFKSQHTSTGIFYRKHLFQNT